MYIKASSQALRSFLWGWVTYQQSCWPFIRGWAFHLGYWLEDLFKRSFATTGPLPPQLNQCHVQVQALDYQTRLFSPTLKSTYLLHCALGWNRKHRNFSPWKPQANQPTDMHILMKLHVGQSNIELIEVGQIWFSYLHKSGLSIVWQETLSRNDLRANKQKIMSCLILLKSTSRHFASPL